MTRIGGRGGWRASVTAAAVTLGALAWEAEAHALPPGCGELIVDDPLAGATIGDQQGGTLGASGFTPGTGSIVWSLPALHHGCVQMTVEGMVTAGVGEHDLIELFTGPDGSFTDGATDHFLLFKIAGDVYPEYEGRLKVEMGLEYSVEEVGTWSENLAWVDTQAYEVVVQLDGAGVASFYRDDMLLGSVDYNSINGGVFDFESVRIPNDGDYQWQAALADIVIRDVRIYDAAPPAMGSSGGADDTAGPSDGTTDTGPGGTGPGASTGSASAGDDTSAGTGPLGGSTSSATAAFPGAGARGGDDDGCSCRTGPTAPTWIFSWVVLLGLARRRRSDA